MSRPVLISVIVPTRGRPASLARALRSILAQTLRDGVELIVVDNDGARSAQLVVESLAKSAPLPLIYVPEPSPGVSNARNAGIARVTGEFIAFLDDDESAPDNWLASLMKAQGEFDADVVFGPVVGQLPPEANARDAVFLQRFFSREGPRQSELIDGYHGCGNSLIRRTALPHPRAPFSPARNRMGGEDDLLFGQMQAAGARFAWTADAWVAEHVPPERATLSYALRRGFAFGQGPSSAAAAAGPRRWAMVPVWMGVGLGQAVVYGALAAWKQARRAETASTLNRAVQGLGKLLWFPPFKLALYGGAPASPLPRGCP